MICCLPDQHFKKDIKDLLILEMECNFHTCLNYLILRSSNNTHIKGIMFMDNNKEITSVSLINKETNKLMHIHKEVILGFSGPTPDDKE